MKSNTIRFAVKLLLTTILVILFCLMFSVIPTSAAESNDIFEHTFIHDYDGAGDCVICHRDVVENVTTSVHNTWMDGDTGKLTGINDFCGTVKSNEQLCGKCHAGFGLPSYDFSVEQVDCLICHAPNYKKTATGPDPNNDMDEIMTRITGEPTREYCLRCHATAGGGNNRKRGDLELVMGSPILSPDIDVHMSQGMLCQDCHTFDGHHVAGQGMDLRVVDSDNEVTCENCHSTKPHNNSIYNIHTDRLYCTACHITSYGKLQPAEISRDWENRSLGSNGKYNEQIITVSNPAPIHVWWDRTSKIMDITDPAIPVNGTVNLAKPNGDLDDPESKIYAARIHTGRQPWDGEFMLPFKVMTVKTTNDMTRAIYDSTRKTYDPVQYVDTNRYMGLFHGVSPATDALRCNDCHNNHKINFAELGYAVEYNESGDLISATKTGSTVNFAKMSGKDCVSCHQIGGFLPTELQVDIEVMNDTESIHYDLNRDAEDTLSPANVRCWACHGEGDGSESVQPSGHGKNFDSPKDCNNGDCHTINQSVFGEPMLGAHFMGADRLYNEGNVLPTENISTSTDCNTCHINSITTMDDSVKSTVAHYGSTRDLMSSPEFMTTDCLYCHEEHYKGDLRDEIADDWGKATDMMDDEADMIEDDEDRTMMVGDTWELRNGYVFEVRNIDLVGDNAHVYLTQNGEIIDDQIINVGTTYVYDHDITVDGQTFEQTDVRINLTGIMRHKSGTVAVFEGRSIKRIHHETTNEACYACHMEGYGNNNRYTIPDRIGDKTYYTKMLIDFDYYNDNTSKTLESGETWDLGDGFNLRTTKIDVDGGLAEIELSRNTQVIESYIIHPGETFYYEDDFNVSTHTFHDLRIFTANVTGIFRSGNTDIITVEDVRLISPDIDVVDVEDTNTHTGFRLDGYNVSQMEIGEDFGGSTPLTLHEASLTNGRNVNFTECIECHDSGSGMDINRIDAINSHLGGHATLNNDGNINGACWACHGSGREPGTHPDGKAKDCIDCHVDNVQFGAMDLSDETHGETKNCVQCHAVKSHVISVFNPNTPHITDVDIPNSKATAVAGWGMKVERFEFWVDDDTPKQIYSTSNDQTQEFEFWIDDDLTGEHRLYTRAMERGKWGPTTMTIFTKSDTTEKVIKLPGKTTKLPITKMGIAIALAHIIGFCTIVVYRKFKNGNN